MSRQQRAFIEQFNREIHTRFSGRFVELVVDAFDQSRRGNLLGYFVQQIVVDHLSYPEAGDSHDRFRWKTAARDVYLLEPHRLMWPVKFRPCLRKRQKWTEKRDGNTGP